MFSDAILETVICTRSPKDKASASQASMYEIKRESPAQLYTLKHTYLYILSISLYIGETRIATDGGNLVHFNF